MTSLFRKYVLDTNVLISASQLHFKFASGTRFWEFMLEAHNAVVSQRMRSLSLARSNECTGEEWPQQRNNSSQGLLTGYGQSMMSSLGRPRTIFMVSRLTVITR